VDTSAAVAFLVPDHKHHDATFEALAQHQLGLAGHAAFET
jgi:predicted nucleic acid-binding protein